MTKLILALCASMRVFSGCNTESEEPNRLPAPGQYLNALVGLEILFPATWQAKLDQKLNGNTKADLQLVGEPINGFAPNLSVVIISPHQGTTNLDSLLKDSHEGLLNAFPSLSGYRDTVSARDGKDVASLEYEVNASGVLLHFAQYIFINNKRDVIMTFSDRADHFLVNTEIQGIRDAFSITPK